MRPSRYDSAIVRLGDALVIALLVVVVAFGRPRAALAETGPARAEERAATDETDPLVPRTVSPLDDLTADRTCFSLICASLLGGIAILLVRSRRREIEYEQSLERLSHASRVADGERRTMTTKIRLLQEELRRTAPPARSPNAAARDASSLPS